MLVSFQIRELSYYYDGSSIADSRLSDSPRTSLASEYSESHLYTMCVTVIAYIIISSNVRVHSRTSN